MQATLGQAGLFTRLVKGASSVAQELVLVSSRDGPVFQCMDSSFTCLVQMHLLKGVLRRYSFQDDDIFVLPLAFLRMCVKSLDDDMELSLRAQPSGFSLEGAAPYKVASFACALQQEQEHHNLIHVDLDRPALAGSACLPTALLVPQLVNMAMMGEDVCIEITKEAIQFSLINTDAVATTISFGHKAVVVECRHPAKVVISVGIVRKILPLMEISSHVSVFVTPDMPVEFEMFVPDLVRSRVFVAPKML
jgi:hypothetical protein